MDDRKVDAKKVDMSVLADFVKDGEPDKDKLAELLVRAKGAKRSMRQFAKDCGANPSTFSRIANRQGSRGSTDETLWSIAQNADPESGVTFRKLMEANGKKVRQLSGRIDRGSIVTREREIRDIILNEILSRGYGVSSLNEQIRHNALNYWYKPDWAFSTNAFSENGDSKRWEFEAIPCMENGSMEIRHSLMRIRQKILMIMGLFYTGDMTPDKFSIVLDNAEQFEMLIATLDGTAIRDVFSVILVDRKAGKVQYEYIFPLSDGREPFKVFAPIEDDSAPVNEEDLLEVDNNLLAD